MKNYQAILFDLDGTLTEPKIGITKSVQYALAKFGIVENDLDKLVPFIGPPLLESFQEFYGLTVEQARSAITYYREYFSTKGMYENGVYAGIPQLLSQLQAQGKKLVVATSKPTIFSEQILKHFNLAQFFSAIVGSNLDGSRIEKTEVIEAAIAHLGDISKEEILMVGDRKHDLIGARNNGIDCAAVTYGYGSLEELKSYSPNYLVHSVKELGELVAD